MFGAAASFVAFVSLLFPGSFLEPVWRLNPRAREGAVSGGKALFVNILPEWGQYFEGIISEFFERIVMDLRYQYRIGYQPKNRVSDGKWRQIEVKVTPPRGMPSLSVRSREGYYAILKPR